MWKEMIMTSFRILTNRACDWRGLEIRGKIFSRILFVPSKRCRLSELPLCRLQGLSGIEL